MPVEYTDILIAQSKQHPSLNMKIYNVSCFQSTINKTSIFGPFLWLVMFRFKPANRKSIISEMMLSFKSLYFLESSKLQLRINANTCLDNFLAKALVKVSMLYVEDLHYVFSTNTAIEQDVIVLTVVIANFIFWSNDVLHCTFNQSLVVTFI